MSKLSRSVSLRHFTKMFQRYHISQLFKCYPLSMKMNANEHVHVILNHLNSRLRHLETRLLGTLNEHTHIHTRRERHGEGERKVQEYMKEFNQFYEQHTSYFPDGFPVKHVNGTHISLILQLNDEDSRYTTDVSPGIYCKQKIFEEYYDWMKNMTRRISRTRY